MTTAPPAVDPPPPLSPISSTRSSAAWRTTSRSCGKLTTLASTASNNDHQPPFRECIGQPLQIRLVVPTAPLPCREVPKGPFSDADLLAGCGTVTWRTHPARPLQRYSPQRLMRRLVALLVQVIGVAMVQAA